MKSKTIPLTTNFSVLNVVGELKLFGNAKITMNDVISLEVRDDGELMSVSIVSGKSYCNFLNNPGKVYGKQDWNKELK